MNNNLVKRFLDYSEIRTKITSVLTFLFVLAYLFAAGIGIRALPTVLFFCGMFLFDLAVTTINNYSDTRKNGQELQFRRPAALAVTISLLLLALAFAVWLVFVTDLAVLLLGGLCFLFGVLYSFGPVPISHGPYGELISGVFYGFFIPVILIYINAPSGWLFSWSLSGRDLAFALDVRNAAGVALLAVTPTCLTANIMLANNICDVDRDVLVGRFTLPYYLKKHSLYLLALLYYLPYLAAIAMVMMRYVSPICLVLLLTIIPVQRNINLFFKKQVKAETFIVSIRNFIIVIVAQAALILIGRFM